MGLTSVTIAIGSSFTIILTLIELRTYTFGSTGTTFTLACHIFLSLIRGLVLHDLYMVWEESTYPSFIRDTVKR